MSKIGPTLAERIKNARDHDTFEVVVFLETEPAREVQNSIKDLDASPERHEIVSNMQSTAKNSQNSLLNYLTNQQEKLFSLSDGAAVPQVSSVESLWINNSIKAEVALETLREIIDRDDVTYVEIERRTDIEELLDVKVLEDRELNISVANSSKPIAWSVSHINAPLLWQLGIDGTDVVVAVVDTGVNYNHPDLKSRMWASTTYPKHGYDFANNDTDPNDSQGHGTSCAGIVAGDGTSGKRTGVAPGAQIMAIRVGGAETQFWRGLQFAVAEGAHVISMSMSWKYPNNPDYVGWRRVCESILAAGVLHANSIGNQGNKPRRYPIPFNIATPGNCPPPKIHSSQNPAGGISSVISCGATNNWDALAAYSGRGPAAWESGVYADYPWKNGNAKGLIKPDICAPGPGTESCNYQYPALQGSKPYKSFGGTSAATPHIGGCLALLANACIRAQKPIIPSLIQEAIETTAVRAKGQKSDKENHFGAGRVDIKAAYDYGLRKNYW